MLSFSQAIERLTKSHLMEILGKTLNELYLSSFSAVISVRTGYVCPTKLQPADHNLTWSNMAA